jgi:hypothetical protein
MDSNFYEKHFRQDQQDFHDLFIFVSFLMKLTKLNPPAAESPRETRGLG